MTRCVHGWDHKECIECAEDLNSNTSTYVVACLVELRVSAPSEDEAMKVASEQFWGGVTEGAIGVSFRIEDQPGSSGCCRQ